MAYKFYNNNPYERNVSDCAVRAIALATNRSWDQTYQELSNYARQQGITFSEIEFIDDYLSNQFKSYCQDKNNRIVTVGDFANLNLPGTWLVTMRGHITCIIDGTIYDTFDPSDRFLWCAYQVK